ncbi:permease-like cell division protein FtsX [Thermobifida fusca]|jgi:cell division transport system permease protein|uniref:Cell division protein FtsX n=2 Tax=Thermobifida fusca TaxID=2021 RepID=A0A9P2T7U2_THEFU|nr:MULTISPECIES: permease-like cell division protein FtsX [Thermobifida]AAZ56510.1 cell division protein FtsX [Thermobifida fusca YX]EOR70406.1 cell division protein FtsX [Thermobifida fusca TM51]MBO2530469.1 ABC transporter permease [Thermobifida sp.]MDD6793509.1 permease-like cell division protein FtsX [Thermobifida fusca]PZN61261.1 MAG: ABC transporter permease [Thermobifida fusca]
MRAQFVLSEIWIGLRRNLTMTIAVITTVAISLALFGAGMLINQQVSAMRGYWDQRISITIYLCTESSPSSHCVENGPATDEDRAAIQADLESMPEVASVEYVDQAQAWEDFQNRFANQQALVEATQEGDIPDNFRVQLVDPSQYEKVQESFRNRAGVDMVSNDKDVLDRFFELFDVLKWAALTFAIVQLAAAALLIGNTIRLSAYSRRRETGIMRLVGASNFYIQLPFLLEGAICGLIGGIIASGFIVAARYVLLDKIQDWFYSGVRLSTGALLSVIGMSIILGVLLCAIASFLTLRRYLRV